MRGEADKEKVVDQYPRLQKVQRMLSVLDRTITEAERSGDPEVRIWIVRGAGEAEVQVSYFRQGELNDRRINLAGELDLSGGETVGLFRWAESEGYIRPNYGSMGQGGEVSIGVLDHLESKGYELIGELPDPQERLALILEAAIRTVQKDDSLDKDEKKRRIDWFEEAKIVVRTFGIEGAKAVLRGDIPPM
jgi:hypothetical protein